MFYTGEIIATAAVIVVALLYKYIEFQKVKVQWGDGTRGLRYQRARQALLALEKQTAQHVKNWRPQVLLFAKVNAAGDMHQPGLLQLLGELKGARGISIISTAIEGSLIDNADRQLNIEQKLREHRDKHGIQGFTQVVMSESIESALDSLLQTAGLGGLGPNTVMTAWPTSWQTAIQGAERMRQILTSAHAFNMALILIKGHETWPTIADVPQGSNLDVWWVVHDGGLLLLLSIILQKHRKWHHCQLRVFVVCGARDKPDTLFNIVNSFLYNMRISARLKCVQLTDGEGLSAILPTRGAEWGSGEGASALRLNKQMISKPLGNLQERTAGDVNEPAEDEEPVGGATPPQPASLAAPPPPPGMSLAPAMMEDGMDPKARTTYAFNQMMCKYSSGSSLVLCNLPLPSEKRSTKDYMAHLEALMAGIPRALLVAGQKDADVITMYS